MTLTATLREMDRLITEIELWTAGQAEEVAALSRSDSDTTEATQRLFEQLGRLTALRLERAEIRRLIPEEPSAAPTSGIET